MRELSGLFACLFALQFRGIEGFTYYSCNGKSPLIHIGTRGTTMHMVDASIASLPRFNYASSACTRLFCRRLKSGVKHWTESTQSNCAARASSCYSLVTTQPLPILSNRGMPGCEHLANVALSGGNVVTPTADGACGCNTFGRDIWMYSDTTYMDTNLDCPNFNQCVVDNGWCATGTRCTDEGGADGYRSCGGCPSGTSGNGDGKATCASCAAGKFSIFASVNDNTVCQACTSTCPAGQGVSNACTDVGRTRNRVCSTCAIGKFNNGSNLACQTCSTKCPVGEGVTQPCTNTGRSLDRICTSCAAGKFQLGNSLTCSNCAVCPAGQGVFTNCSASANRVCLPCANNTYSLGGVSACLPCTEICPPDTQMTRACSSSKDSVCTYNLVGNCSNGVAVTAAIGEANGTLFCNSANSSLITPRGGGGSPPVSVVVDIVIRDGNGDEIPVSALEDGQFIEFFLPFAHDALAQEENSCGVNDRERDLECAWWVSSQQQFVSSGCVKKSLNASGVVCSCTHLTEFALILKMHGICKQELSAQEFVLMAVYMLICFAALCQCTRLFLFKNHAQKTRGFIILRNEHLLLALAALLRGIQIMLRGEVSAPFLAIFAGIPHTVELGMYTFVVFSWVGGVLLEGASNPFQKLKYPFVVTMLVFAGFTIGFPIGIAATQDVKTQIVAARVGSYCMGVVTYLGTGLVLFFGIQLYRKLHAIKSTHSSGGTESLALKILKLTIAVGLQFCLIATLFIVMVAEVVIADDVAFAVLQLLYHAAVAMLLITLLVMFSKAVNVQVKKVHEPSSGNSVSSTARSMTPLD